MFFIKNNTESKRLYQFHLQEYKEELLKKTKVVCILSLILMPAGISVDYLIYPQYLYDFVICRIWCNIFLGILLAIANTRFGIKLVSFINIAVVLITGLSLIFMIYLSDGYGSSYYVGVILIYVAIGALMTWRAWRAFYICSMILAIYIGACLLNNRTEIDYKIFYTNVYYMSLAIILAVVGTYYNSRKLFEEFKIKYNLKKTLEEKERTEAQLIQSEKMNSLGILAAGIMHEINNPLSVIAVHLALIEQQPVNNRIKKYITTIRDIGIEQIKEITTNLRQFCNSEKDVGQFSLIELIQIAKSLAISEIKNIDISLDIDEDTIVFVSKNELILVFTNLLINAAYALKESDKEDQTVKITASEKDNMIYINFRDNGVGIKKSNLKNVFDPFFTTKPTGVGLGLGLSISYKIIDKHGGDFRVNSKENEWTEFIFTLPCTEEENNVEN